MCGTCRKYMPYTTKCGASKENCENPDLAVVSDDPQDKRGCGYDATWCDDGVWVGPGPPPREEDPVEIPVEDPVEEP